MGYPLEQLFESLFSRMRSEGFPFTIGGHRVGPVFASRVSSLRLSSFRAGVSSQFRAHGKSFKRDHFRCFKCDVTSFRVAGVALCDMWTCCCPRWKSPCPWGKLQNLSFSKVSTCQNWRKSRTKCSFWCSHMSPLESLAFLWRRRVYGGSCNTFPFRRCHSKFLPSPCLLS